MPDNTPSMFGRKKGDDSWYTPDRDILQVMPSCIVRGAAYAVDPTSSIYNWLTQQEGVNKANVVEKMTAALKEMLNVLDDLRAAPLNEVLTPGRIEWPLMQAMMFGAGIVGLNTYNLKFREARLTRPTGQVDEPTACIDHLHAMRIFTDLITQLHGKKDEQAVRRRQP